MTLELRTPYEADPRYNRLTPGQRALYVLSWADAEILNGGFSQFYFNSTGYFAPDLPASAELVGAPEHARIATRANALLAGERAGVPRARGPREALLDRVPAKDLSDLDERWYALSDRGILPRRTAAYVRRHPAEFLAR